MSEPVKIVIAIEGGLVQGVVSAGVPVEYTVVDYDTEGAEDEDIIQIPQSGGYTAKAVGHSCAAHIDGPWALAAIEAVREHEVRGDAQ